MFGKIKQVSLGLNIDRNKTGVNINERMDLLIPASKIANQNTGEMVGVVARENTEAYGKYDTNTFRCRISVDMRSVREEQSHYRDLPRYHSFGNLEHRERFLIAHLQKVCGEVEGMVL